MEVSTIINFDRSANNEMLVNLQVRDEDLTETLKVRWRVVLNDTETPPPGTPATLYPCPEPTIEGNGALLRNPKTIRIESNSFARGKCSRVDFIVSASFKMCRPDRTDWDVTTLEDDDSDIGRLSFFVWDTSDLMKPGAAEAIRASCPQTDYVPPSSTSATSTAASGQ